MSTTPQILPHRTDPLKWISTITAGLVATLALLAFILSYNALQHTAQQHGIPWPLSLLWPLLLDFAMVVFSLAILRANLRQELARYPWALVILFSSLAVLGNILDVATLGLNPTIISAGVRALAPIALVLAFELLMSMIRAEVKRSAVIESLQGLQERHEQLLNNVGKLAQQEERLQASLRDLRKEKRSYTAIGDETRAQAAQILGDDPDITGGELGRKLGKAASTGRRLKRELAPQLNGNGAQ
jgi:hypothetical protein